MVSIFLYIFILMEELCIINRKGYISDPLVNIPVIYYLVALFKDDKMFKFINKSLNQNKDEKTKYKVSIHLNIIFYYLLLILMLRLLIKIEQ